jgi:hypothetical protein
MTQTDVLSPRMFCPHGRFVRRTFCPHGRFVPTDLLSDERFVATDVLSQRTFCPHGRFVHGGFVSGRFVWAPYLRYRLWQRVSWYSLYCLIQRVVTFCIVYSGELQMYELCAECLGWNLIQRFTTPRICCSSKSLLTAGSHFKKLKDSSCLERNFDGRNH